MRPKCGTSHRVAAQAPGQVFSRRGADTKRPRIHLCTSSVNVLCLFRYMQCARDVYITRNAHLLMSITLIYIYIYMCVCVFCMYALIALQSCVFRACNSHESLARQLCCDVRCPFKLLNRRLDKTKSQETSQRNGKTILGTSRFFLVKQTPPGQPASRS